jgi:phosphoribosylglycinamide formyltransferase-1
VLVYDKELCPDKAEFYKALTETFQMAGIDYLVLAGWLLIVPKDFIESFEDKIINIHPALLPSFGGKGYYGLNVHKAVLEYGAKLSGATVHFVSSEVDGGAIIMQRAVEVKEDDTPESLQERILKEEHIILPLCVKLFCEGKILKSGRQVRVLD